MTSLADRLASLPAPIAELAQPVVELAQSGASDKLGKPLAKLMAAVKFSPNKESVRERPILLARSLKPEQRAVAELLAELPQVSLEGWPLYTTPWLRRRWLGLEPGGALFSEIVLALDDARVRWPLIHGVRHLVNVGDDERAVSLIATLPMPERADVLAGLALADRDIDISCFAELIEQTPKELLEAATLRYGVTSSAGELPVADKPAKKKSGANKKKG